MTECYSRDCQVLAAGEGTAAWFCEHEHMVTEADFCGACWIVRITAAFHWFCGDCEGRMPDGSTAEWGHLCSMTLVQPGERMSA